ncbi:MAG: PA14 domain-containing protein, partial [Tepidisphaeraceae bacterium]
KAGETYDIRLDYYDNAFDATMRLSWSSASTTKQIIPTSQLYADAGWTSGAWLGASIGGADGSVSSLGKTYKVIGGGGGTTGSSDQFEYLYQTLNGDGVLIAQVAATQGTSGGAEAGVMIRDSLAGDAAFASVVVNASGIAAFETRAGSGENVESAAASTGSGLYWLKIVRDGNFFRGYASSSGGEGSWKYFGSLNVPMGRTVYAGVTATSGANGGTNGAQFKNISVRSVAPIGAGLDQIRDYSMGQVFVDLAKQARTPSRPNLGPAAALDANGWAAEDFMTILSTGYKDQAHLLNGTYKVSFTGQADLSTWITPGGQIQNKVYNAATNTTTADLIVAAAESNDNWYIALQFINSRRDPGGATNTGITNLKVIRPGYAADTTQFFQNGYLEHLKQFGVLRFMDWGATNNNQVVDWSQRTTPGSARQSSTSGVAWEYAIDLANQLDKDVWINLPAKANDAYVQQLAQLLKDNLEPDRVVYIEYSNEVWNGIFSQNQENLAMAQAEVAAGNSMLNADGETNQIYWGWRRVANRLKQISDIFGDVWGGSEINARVRPVLAGQHSNPDVIRHGIEFIERTCGAPSQFFYGLAVAPYIAMGSIDDTNPNMTVQEIIDKLQGSATSNANRFHTHDTFARRYGLANLAYEGGPDVAGPNNLTNKKLAMLDSRMKAVIASYLDGWYRAGGGLFEWFVAGPTVYSVNGMWGVTNHPEDLDSPKAEALADIAANPRTPLQFGQAIPGAFDARAVAGATQPYATTYRADPGAGMSFDYFLRAPRAGVYQITFRAGTAGSNEQIRVAINDSDVRTITLKNTGSATSFADNLVGTFQLEAGMNLIHVTSIKETSWNIQTVTVSAPTNSPNRTPTVESSANATPTSVNTKTTSLSVLGDDADGGESGLIYSWEAIGELPMSVTFSSNGSNAAKNTTATFSRAGTYELRVTISDGEKFAISAVSVTVNQVITTVAVTPTGQPVANGETKQLTATAKDQFGVQLYAQPAFTWTIDNGFGTVSSSGLYQSPASGLGTATVRATVNGVSATATVVTQSPRPADVVANPLPGIEYSYYEGTWTVLPNFDTLTPVESGLLNNVSIAPRNRNDNFAFQYTGFVNVPNSGTYTFYVTSDDGSKLWIGGQQVVNNDGL